MALAMFFIFSWVWFIAYYNTYLVSSLVSVGVFYIGWRVTKWFLNAKLGPGNMAKGSLVERVNEFTERNFVNVFFAGILVSQWIYDRDKFFALPASTIYWYVALAYFGSWACCAASHYIFKE